MTLKSELGNFIDFISFLDKKPNKEHQIKGELVFDRFIDILNKSNLKYKESNLIVIQKYKGFSGDIFNKDFDIEYENSLIKIKVWYSYSKSCNEYKEPIYNCWFKLEKISNRNRKNAK